MSSDYALFVIFGFLAVVMLLAGGFLLWNDNLSPELQRIKQRLHLMARGEVDQPLKELARQRLLSNSASINQWLTLLPRVHKLDQLLLQAGSSRTVAQWLLAVVLGGGFGILIGLVLHWTWLLVLLSGLAVMLSPVMLLLWRRANRMQKISTQLPDALDLISRALRAGHAFSAALAMVGAEAQEPIAGEFRTTFDEINFGISTKNALLNLAGRVPAADMRYFVLAVTIQLETGGNLTALLGILATLIRERFKLFGKIKVLAAEGKMSAYILTALPFLVAGMLQIVNPGYMHVLFTDPTGIKVLKGALVMMLIGVFLLWRITKIRI